ncbi:MAG: hypothetical protein WAU31_01870 [Candidatus Moraniibacteriota bacterium]
MKTKKIVGLHALALGIFCAIPAHAAMELPTAADCAERTGKTEAECQEMMESFKNRKPPEGMPRGGALQGNLNDPQTSPPSRGEQQKPIARENNNAKQNQHWRLQRIVTHVEKIIAFLTSQNFDTSTIEGNFQVFQEKAKTAALAAESFEEARVAFQENQSVDNSDLTQARTDLHAANQEALKYYRETLLPNIKKALDSIR